MDNRLPFDRLTLSLAEAADSLSIPLGTLRKKVASGEIPSAKIGRRRVVPTAALTAYLESITTSIPNPKEETKHEQTTRSRRGLRTPEDRRSVDGLYNRPRPEAVRHGED